MDENQKLERGIIPAGTRIKLYEGSITLLEDAVVDAHQKWIDKAIQDEKDFYNGVGVIGEGIVDGSSSNYMESMLMQGALSSMAVSNTISESGSKILQVPARIEIVDNLVFELRKLSDDIAVESPQASALAVLDVGVFLLRLLQQR